MVLITWRFRYPTFTGLRTFEEGAVVDDRVEGGVNEIEDLVVGPGMPVFLRVWDVLERGNCSN